MTNSLYIFHSNIFCLDFFSLVIVLVIRQTRIPTKQKSYNLMEIRLKFDLNYTDV